MLIAMLFPAPPAPAFPPDQATKNALHPRYEDCTQDGRLTTLAIPPSLATTWNARDARNPGARRARATGLVSLLTRLTVTSLDRPVRVNRPFEVVGGFQLAHDRDAAGAVSKLFMNVWTDVHGRPHLSPEARQADDARRASGQPAELVLAGQAFAEHTYTRPFGPPDQRRVTSLAGVEGVPEVPEARYHQPAPASAAEAPEGASWIDELAPDPVETMFTLDQTDANQHVNSLIYVRLFLAAVQRRLASGGHPARLRSKAFDIAYRKPCFVGDRIRAHIRMFAHGDHIGGAGLLAAEGEEARPRCYVRVIYGP
jgi:hypothetical protein